MVAVGEGLWVLALAVAVAGSTVDVAQSFRLLSRERFLPWVSGGCVRLFELFCPYHVSALLWKHDFVPNPLLAQSFSLLNVANFTYTTRPGPCSRQKVIPPEELVSISGAHRTQTNSQVRLGRA